MPDITITYRDHVIEYHEGNNEWTCDSFEHRRASPSLALAKSRVDKIIDGPDEKPKPFERVDVWTQRSGKIPKWNRTREQASRVAWRIIKDWLEAQLALIQAEMVTLEQVFLPYAQNGAGVTVYESLQAGQFNGLALPAPRQ